MEKDIIYSKCGSSFTYLLLDPRITKDLPTRVDEITPIETWKTFIKSIFYIGKGTQSRPNDHMNEAMHAWIGINKCRSGKVCPNINFFFQLYKIIFCVYIILDGLYYKLVEREKRSSLCPSVS